MSTSDLAALQAHDWALSERVSRTSLVRSRAHLQRYMSWINTSEFSDFTLAADPSTSPSTSSKAGQRQVRHYFVMRCIL